MAGGPRGFVIDVDLLAFSGRYDPSRTVSAHHRDAGWLDLARRSIVMKTDSQIQDKAMEWRRIAWPPDGLVLIPIPMAAPRISVTVRVRWVARLSSTPDFPVAYSGARP